MIGGFKVTHASFLQEESDDAVSRGKVGGARGLPRRALPGEGSGRAGPNAFPASFANLSVRPKAIRITPPGPTGAPDAGTVEKGPKEFEINMLRCIFCGYCQEVCPEEAIFLMRDYSLNGSTREEMIYNKEKLLALGGVHHDKIQKWKHKADEAQGQGVKP